MAYGHFILIDTIDHEVILKEPIHIPSGATASIKDGIIQGIPAFHDLIYKVNIGVAYCFINRIRIVQNTDGLT